MTQSISPNHSSEIIETGTICTLEELCLSCHVDADWIAALVEHGVIEPLSESGSSWRFASLSILRVAKAKRLERDLSLTPPGVALVLELLDEIADLRARLKAFEGGPEANVNS